MRCYLVVWFVYWVYVENCIVIVLCWSGILCIVFEDYGVFCVEMNGGVWYE